MTSLLSYYARIPNKWLYSYLLFFQARPGQSEEFISSLFNQNPEIPRLAPDPSVTPAKEAVFSSQAFDDVGIHPFLVKNLLDSKQITTMTSVQVGQ